MNPSGKMPPIVAALLFLTGTTVVMGAVVTYNAGAVRVSVEEKKAGGSHVHLFVPAVVVPPALDLVPEEQLREKLAEVRPWLPAIRIASRELAGTPDAVLVEVINSHEHVTITHRGGSLMVDVDSDEESVHIAVPLGMVHAIAEKLEASGPPV
jgi:hypothetical protein